MIESVGIIGVGHLASYIVGGLRRASHEIKIILSPRNINKSKDLATRFGTIIAQNNQDVVNSANIIIITTRPEDTITVSENLRFQTGQIVISMAIGITLENLKSSIAPATVVRANTISCAAINQSPTLLFPDNPQARTILALLGQVHVLPDEACFTSASAIGAFYGWIYALLDETISWTTHTGVPQQTARNVVLETVRGAVNMALNEPNSDLKAILATLATPGGITKQGLNVLHQKQSLEVWTNALNVVHKRLSNVKK
ncbi:MAG: NAD(P)-binding domain-containing protein [Candidatus Heimdallarchaeota archaeon]|nr:MAG: NAD(P)-binding domain-containing protein [Candidatus Heimdallarchaeota archaeon]